MWIAALSLISFIVGYALGREVRVIRERLKSLEAKKPEVGVTTGSYGKINEYNVNQPGETGLVMPKTPQQQEWEESERLREAQHGVHIKR